MAVDEQSSQDSTLIDDDLVAALGFEPVATIDTETPTGENHNGADASNGEIAMDVAADEVVRDDLSTNGDHDGFGVDEVADATVDVSAVDVSAVDVIDDVSVGVEERGSFFDLATSDSDTIAAGDANTSEIGTDVTTTDEASVDEPSIDDVAPEIGTVSEISSDGDESPLEPAPLESAPLESAVLESAPLDEATDDVVSLPDGDDDLTSVASIADPELDENATAPVDLIDLESEHVTSGDAEVEAPAVDGDVIDLDTVDLSDDVTAEGVADLDVQELADADSVFADATPVLDPPAFDEPIGHPPTETVDQVGSGLLDLDTAAETVGTAAVASTATATATKGRRRLRARKSRRVIRHIDPWSVLTFSVLFHMVVFAALLLSSVLVWNAAIASGMVENVESFIQELGDYETFEINADVMFRAAIVIAGMLTLASSVLVVLLTVVFNLISDLVGGIRVTVIEEETVRVPIDKKRSKARNE